MAAVDACRWSTKSVPYAPYVTSLPWISHYGCQFVVHGDDITSDSSGEDCYRFVKAADRFLVVKRTPGISTTDLVGRMLLCTKNHFVRSFSRLLSGKEGPGNVHERRDLAKQINQRIEDYASDETGLQPGVLVLQWAESPSAETDTSTSKTIGSSTIMVDGVRPRPGQRVVYVDGGFDLFSSGHIEFLRQVAKAEEALGHRTGWYEASAVQKRCAAENGNNYGPAYIVAGVHDDEVINHWKGVNYPIMNIVERGLCVLQCRVRILPSRTAFRPLVRRCTNANRLQYINSVIFSAPFIPSKAYLTDFPFGTPDAVYHGPTAFMPLTYDPYAEAKQMGIYQEIGNHDFQHVNAGEIVQRILRSRQMYEERQRKKGEKATGEEAVRRREEMEEQAASLQQERAANR